jgi:molecular chaperone GrpE
MNEPEKTQPESQNQSPDEAQEQAPVESLSSTDETSNTDSDSEQWGSDLAAELEAAQAEISKLKDAFLRAKAEEDNIRRRAEKEVASSRKFAVESFAKELTNVHDSLKLACSVELDEDADEAIKSVHEGVAITLKQLDSALSKFSVVEITPKPGDKLDPNLHQAMSLVESADVPSGHILNVIQTGFSMHDRLLRPALVMVAK